MKTIMLNSFIVLISTFSFSIANAVITDADIQNNSTELFQEFLDAAKSVPSAQASRRRQSGYDLNGLQVAAACTSFINANDVMGPYGRLTQEELVNRQSDYARMMSPNALGDYCPNYKNLQPRGRAFVWTVILTAMAHFESSCDGEETAVGPNGNLRGLFQLHEGSEARYDGDDNECIRNASYSEENSIKCALSIIDLQLQNRGTLFTNRSHWEVLRPNGPSQRADDIQRAMRNSSLCKI
jgi:hypothetical protein